MLHDVASLIKQTFSDWIEDKAPQLGAALAYYAIFSIPPLLIVVLASVGFFYDGDVAGGIQREITKLVGEPTARTIMETAQYRSGDRGVFAGIIGVFLLLFGATGVFGALQDALNTIWEVQPKPRRGILGIIKDRFLSFTLVLGIALLLLIALVISAALAALGGLLNAWLPGGEAVAHLIEWVISFVGITILFATIFKLLPDATVAWKDVWIGAAATAALFTIGKTAIGLYLGKGDLGEAYGTAGAVIVLIVWVYYSAQILFLGAEFTQVYANKYGSHVVPDEDAERMTSTS
jgi:membrane protein